MDDTHVTERLKRCGKPSSASKCYMRRSYARSALSRRALRLILHLSVLVCMAIPLAISTGCTSNSTAIRPNLPANIPVRPNSLAVRAMNRIDLVSALLAAHNAIDALVRDGMWETGND